MRTILLIATGGTIASRPTAAGGLAPAITSQELLSCVPELAEFCRIDTIQLYNLDSTNMGPEQWQGIAAAVQENYDRYDGFVITHGTDTMGYTAAALSYMIQKSPKPVVLTGSQKSIYNRDTDARNNLWRAVAYACHPDAWGVQIVFDNQVILGTRARKTRTKSFNAFSSIDYPETAMFRDRRLIQFLQRPAEYTHAVFSTALDPNVFVLRLVPGMRADIIPMLEGRYRALVLESFGVGGIPQRLMDAFAEELGDYDKTHKILILTTQVTYEGSDVGIYEVGKRVKNRFRFLEAHDMTIEAVVTKVMWLLAQNCENFDQLQQRFYRQINFDTFYH